MKERREESRRAPRVPAGVRPSVFMICLLAVLLVWAAGFVTPAAHADDEVDTAFQTDLFDVRITANSDNSYDVVETIDVKFVTERHGIYRYIPRSRDYWVHDVSVDGDPAKVYTLDDDTVIQIGDKHKYVTGRKTYTIRYTISFVSDFDASRDQMYLDVIPASWRTAIAHARVTITCPDNMDWSDIRTYSGEYGTKSDAYGEWTKNEDRGTLTYAADDLPDHTGVTVRAFLPEGTWSHVPLAAPKTWALLVIIALFLAALIWVRRSMKKESHPDVVETVEFYPPDDLSSAELGYVAEDGCSPSDVTSLLFGLAADGCVRIEERPASPGDKLKNGRDYAFIRTGEPGENRFKKMYFQMLFGKRGEDEEARGEDSRPAEVTLGSIKKTIGKGYDQIAGAVENKFKTGSAHGLYSSLSTNRRVILYVLYGAVIFLAEYLFGVHNGSFVESALMAFGAAALPDLFVAMFENGFRLRRAGTLGDTTFSFVMSFLFLGLYLAIFIAMTWQEMPHWLLVVMLAYTAAGVPLLMNTRNRTAYGAKLYGRTLGFRNFLKTAESDRLQELLKEDPDYYGKMVPYAFAFGLLKVWEKKFAALDVTEPDWTAAAGGAAFGAAAGLSSAFSSIASDISSEVTETSSMFGGDGGSGGGGGGGGGGSW